MAQSLCNQDPSEIDARSTLVEYHSPYDEVLRLPCIRRSKTNSFRQRYSGLFVVKHIHGNDEAANEAIWKIQGSLETARLVHPEQKTKVILVTNRQRLELK